MKPKNIALQVVFMIEIAFTKFKIWIYLSGKLSQSTVFFLRFCSLSNLMLCVLDSWRGKYYEIYFGKEEGIKNEFDFQEYFLVN